MQLNFKTISVGLFALSVLQSGGGNARKHISQQSERAEHRELLNSALAEKQKEFDRFDAASKVALGRLRAGATMVVRCSTRENTVLKEGDKVCLSDGTPVNDGIIATWLLSTGEVNSGRVSAVANIVTSDRKEALKILEQRGGFK